MTTNLHYLIAGMAVLLVVLWQYSHQRQMDDRNSLMFRRLLTVVSLDVLAELVSTCFILYAPYSFGVGRMLSNTVFYLFQAILPLMLLYYVCTLCSSRVISTGTVLRMGIPTIALVFIILTNPFTEKLFYFDSTGYCHGPWYLLLYISALLHIAAAAIFVAVHRDAVSRRNLTALLTVFLLAAFGIAAQAANAAIFRIGGFWGCFGRFRESMMYSSWAFPRSFKSSKEVIGRSPLSPAWFSAASAGERAGK